MGSISQNSCEDSCMYANRLPDLAVLWELLAADFLLYISFKSLLYHLFLYRIRIILIYSGGFPNSTDGKESACNVKDLGSIPRLGRSPGDGNGYPLQYSGLENSMDCIVHGVAKSRTHLNDFHFTMKEEQWQEILLRDLGILKGPVHMAFQLPTCTYLSLAFVHIIILWGPGLQTPGPELGKL